MDTVKSHVKRILRKLAAANRAEAVSCWLRSEWRCYIRTPHPRCNMFSMSTQSLRDLRANLGTIVRDVAYSGDEVIVTDSGTEVAVIISMGDYERLHEHADIADAVRLRELRRTPFTPMTMAQMLDELGLDPAQVHAS